MCVGLYLYSLDEKVDGLAKRVDTSYFYPSYAIWSCTVGGSPVILLSSSATKSGTFASEPLAWQYAIAAKRKPLIASRWGVALALPTNSSHST